MSESYDFERALQSIAEAHKRRHEHEQKVAEKILAYPTVLSVEQIIQRIIFLAKKEFDSGNITHAFFVMDRSGEFKPSSEIVDLGWQLARLGYPNIELMQQVYYSAGGHINFPHWFSNLQKAWDGVGFWQY